MIPSAEEVINRSKIHPSRVKCIYAFGSRVYGTSTYDSDWDFEIIANNSVPNQEIRSGDFNIHIITPDEFQKLLNSHHPSSIECFYTPEEFRIKEDIKFNWNPNISSLRHSFSHTSSNSWVKCKKKMEQGDYYIGVKSLFHSIRIPMFGTQIAKYGKIEDFSEANFIHERIFSKKWTWEELDFEFRLIKNSILSEFRSVTSK